MSSDNYVGVLQTKKHGESVYRVAVLSASEGGIQTQCTECNHDLPEGTVMERARELYRDAKVFTDVKAAEKYSLELADTTEYGRQWVSVPWEFEGR